MYSRSLRKSILVTIGATLLSALPLAKEIPKQGPPPKKLVKQPDGHWSPYKAAATPEGGTVHVVVQGDTLWDLSKKYLENPYLWPQIWELNDYIKNPHWIYPGDPVLIKQPIVITEERLKKETAKEEAESKPPEMPPTPPEPVAEQPEPLQPKKEVPLITAVELYCSGFITMKGPDMTHLIVGAEDEKNKSQFAEGDIVYINQGLKHGVAAGAEYSVLRPLGKVKNQITKENVGKYVGELGRVRVLIPHEETSTAQIVFSCDTILIGDVLEPFVERASPVARERREFDPSYRKGSPSGYIVLAKDDIMALGAGHIVHIDLGKDAGVKPGDYFTIYRDFTNFGLGGLWGEKEVDPSYSAGLPKYSSRKKKAVRQREMPKKALGQLVVFSVHDRAAVAKILYNREEIAIGDEVKLQREEAKPGDAAKLQ